uniref:ABC transporter domain-containing protein n=1 Tax=Aureoumbra lagunensis TaxID=44058 RepID=A0A7S3NJK4_9STRA|mmetsp:Transcript_8071/g.11246  ORF Transcript_8071/g.11246 Transcript_8071/m.11246 type:complete len:677 (+) Transcript_8071:77-2107(+)|eukprot:CAMPEP_0197313662 /NCGR_PEP_ID=MMETSP0891-20130614/29121_1 /TAXON_ID=44058 ORGANISM="Aureoumbra lagunensis, Strain CCMP1510" /NCGR_SAMPLE_ID=MMETSP0891 /ASSEMBLY_ACC=CAM_ASM_000534 /LENGTH=676 /DNA_ID=CAMNT_0042801657 /DNA_START=77 /DNA_END=2107 /DNA_ORIENTATION=-
MRSVPTENIDKIAISCESLSCHFRGISTRFGETQALAPVSGDIEAGEVTMLAGPSGSGKSTLLNAICRRGPISEGDMWYSDGDRGLTWSKSLKKLVAFVEQEDHALANLTVRETLLFSARLRLPKTSVDEKKQIVDETIALLKLTKVADSKVGSTLVRGISGGEKKRLLIGVDMLTKPLLLALDEPTSGLDSAVAATVVDALRHLAQSRNVSVVTSLHQPSSRIFLSCHKLLLLDSQGIVYRGPTEIAGDALSDPPLNLPCPGAFSAPDWLIEVIVRGELSTKSTVNAINEKDGKENLQESFAQDMKDVENPKDNDQIETSKENTNSASSIDNIQIPPLHIRKARRALINERYGVHSLPARDPSNKLQAVRSIRKREDYSVSFSEQIRVLFTRTWKEVRPTIFDRNSVTLHLGNAILAGIMWWRMSYREADVWPRITLSFAVPIAWVFYPLLDSLTVVPKSEIMLKKELSSNSYMLAAWYCTTTTTLLTPMFAQSFMHVSLVFLLSNLGPLLVWFIMYLTVFLALLCFQSIGLLFSAAIPAKNLMTVALLYVTFCFLYTGIFVPLDATPIPFIAFLNPMIYIVGLSIHVVFGLNGRKYRCSNNVDDAGTLYPKSCDDDGDGKIAPVEILREYGLRPFSPAVCIAALLAFMLISRISAFFILKRRMKRHLAEMSKYD